MSNRIFSDKIQTVKAEYDAVLEPPIPVDLNGSYVPFNKWNPKNLDIMQESIRNKFQMEQSWADSEIEEVIDK